MRTFIRVFTVLALVAGAAPTAQAQSKDIVETAVAAGSFTTLARALQAADLVDTLKGTGPFTVFAPTDEAFAKLPAGTLDSLLQPSSRERLRRVLTAHVVSGRVTSTDVVKLESAKTVSGYVVPIRTAAGRVSIAGATVVTPDIMASNGVIHVIDTVIVPTDSE